MVKTTSNLRGTSFGRICNNIANNIANKIYYTPLVILQHELLWKTCILIHIVFVQTPHFREKRLSSFVISVCTNMLTWLVAPIGRISGKFYIMDFLRISMDIILNVANIGHFT